MSGMKESTKAASSGQERQQVIAAWHYAQGDYAELRYHGAFEEWLEWTVRIVPPEEVMQRYARIAPPRPAPSPPRARSSCTGSACAPASPPG